MKKLQGQVKATLERIAYIEDAAALKRLHANIHRHPELEDVDREALDEAVMLRLRVVSPSIATRLGGPCVAFKESGNQSLAASAQALG